VDLGLKIQQSKNAYHEDGEGLYGCGERLQLVWCADELPIRNRIVIVPSYESPCRDVQVWIVGPILKM
jgi:hypothetical protein